MPHRVSKGGVFRRRDLLKGYVAEFDMIISIKPPDTTVAVQSNTLVVAHDEPAISGDADITLEGVKARMGGRLKCSAEFMGAKSRSE